MSMKKFQSLEPILDKSCVFNIFLGWFAGVVAQSWKLQTAECKDKGLWFVREDQK